ncbi:MAG: hypothetical protein J7M38_10220 [Armatimonadetes bacterium]|nr:hypothetical protein [Armatimonadota bacterium]
MTTETELRKEIRQEIRQRIKEKLEGKRATLIIIYGDDNLSKIILENLAEEIRSGNVLAIHYTDKKAEKFCDLFGIGPKGGGTPFVAFVNEDGSYTRGQVRYDKESDTIYIEPFGAG